MTATKRSIGGGNEGEGGPLSDAAVISKPNPNSGRAQSDYRTRANASEQLPTSIASVADADESSVHQYTLIAEFNDYLFCRLLTTVNGVETVGESNYIVAKPGLFRKTEVDTDGEEVNGEIVTYAPDGIQGTKERENVEGGYSLFEHIYPSYTLGDRIYAAECEFTGLVNVQLIDLNTAGRSWKSIESGHKYFVIDDLDRDTFDCWEWNPIDKVAIIPDGAPGEDRYLVAKPMILRGSYWHDQQIGGTFYDAGDVDESGSHDYRDAGDNIEFDGIVEHQEIIPEWLDGSTFPNITVIEAEYIETGTGAYRNEIQAYWQDKNVGAHAFAEKFE